jgi:hypothetical protein
MACHPSVISGIRGRQPSDASPREGFQLRKPSSPSYGLFPRSTGTSQPWETGPHVVICPHFPDPPIFAPYAAISLPISPLPLPPIRAALAFGPPACRLHAIRVSVLPNYAADRVIRVQGEELAY